MESIYLVSTEDFTIDFFRRAGQPKRIYNRTDKEILLRISYLENKSIATLTLLPGWTITVDIYRSGFHLVQKIFKEYVWPTKLLLVGKENGGEGFLFMALPTDLLEILEREKYAIYDFVCDHDWNFRGKQIDTNI